MPLPILAKARFVILFVLLALPCFPSPARADEWLFDIAEAHRAAGRLRPAFESYQRYLQAEPDGLSSRQARGHITRLVHELEEAATRLRERGAATLATGPVAAARAIADFTEAEALVPSLETPFLLGEASFAAWQLDAAEAQYRAYLAGAPDGAHVADARRRLEEVEQRRGWQSSVAPHQYVRLHIESDNPTPVNLRLVKPNGDTGIVCHQPCDRTLPREGFYEVFGEKMVSTWGFRMPATGDVTLQIHRRPMARRRIGVLMIVLGGLGSWGMEGVILGGGLSSPGGAVAIGASILVGVSTTIWGIVLAAKRSRLDVVPGITLGKARLGPEGLVF